jgi:membrane protease YdiL (CAAX protease family)
MDPPIRPELLPVIFGVFLLGVGASIVIWLTIARRLAGGEAVLPYERRRPVPWHGRDVGLILLVYLAPALLSLALSGAVGPKEVLKPAPHGQEKQEKVDISHPVIELLRSRPDALTLLFCVFTVVLVAPIVEEVLFRLLLQGWLESVETGARRQLRRWSPVHGFWSVAIPAVLFASLHFRTAQPPPDPEELLLTLAWVASWNMVTMAVAAVWLRVQRGATLSDLGIVPRKLPADIRLGLLTFLAIAAPIYLVQAGLQWVLKDVVAADPLTLSFFAVALGLLYFRTHRLVPSIVLHMALNGTSLALAWLLAG